MMKARTLVALLLITALVMGMLGGCGSSSSTETSETSSAETETVSEESEEVSNEDAEEVADEAEETEVEDSSEEDTEAAEESSDTSESSEAPEAVSLPLTEETVELTLFSASNPNALSSGLVEALEDGYFWQELEERTGVHISCGAIHPATQTESYNLLIASGDYPDLTYNVNSLYSGGLSSALTNEIIIDISDYLEYCPNYVYYVLNDEELYRDVVMDGGTIGAFYNVYPEAEYMDQGGMIRSDWLEELGLDMPTTYDEYYEVLTAFKTNYDATLWMPASGTLAYGFLQSGYDTYVNNIESFYQIDGEIVCGYQAEGTRSWLEMLSQWYSEGLIYQDYISQSEGETLSSQSDEIGNLTNGDYGVWLDEVNAMSTYTSMNADFECEPAINPTVEEGGTTHVGYYTSRINVSAYSISTTCENIELAVQWVDYLYSEEGSLLANWGVEGETFEYDENGDPYFTDLIVNNPDGLTYSVTKFIYLCDGGAFIYDRDRDNQSYTETQLTCVDVWSSNYDAEWTLSSELSFTEDETETYSELIGDIETYVSESINKFITGAWDIDAYWDEFQASLIDLGIEEIIEIYQAAYDRWLER